MIQMTERFSEAGQAGTLSLPDVLIGVSRTLDLVSPELADHNLKVGCIAGQLADHMGWSDSERRTLLSAAMLHDCGALSTGDKLKALAFELALPHEHAETGYRLLRDFAPMTLAAELVRHHHVPWDNGSGETFRGRMVLPGSHLIHLADRLAVCITPGEPILPQVARIRRRVEKGRGSRFVPEMLDALASLARHDAFWLRTIRAEQTMRELLGGVEATLIGREDLPELGVMLARVIDFRSPFTAAHSTGVAEVAARLAQRLGFDDNGVDDLRMAGLLHDLGKLAVPIEIIDKPAPLTAHERGTMRGHTFFTFQCLDAVAGLEDIKQWAAYHHERLDGRGYPFGLKAKDLPLGSRIVAVADVFAALSENRPYRDRMPAGRSRAVLKRMVNNGGLDDTVVEALIENYATIDKACELAQGRSRSHYTRTSATDD